MGKDTKARKIDNTNSPHDWQAFQAKIKKPPVGLEPTTYGLQNHCSTIELGWQYKSKIKIQKSNNTAIKTAKDII